MTPFWEIEVFQNLKICNSEELIFYNEHLKETHFRKTDDKYVVESHSNQKYLKLC